MNSNQRTLYDRVGGEMAVAMLVDRFYDRVLKDAELEPYFRNVPMEKLLAMQLDFFSAALDGPVRYSGRPVDQVHKGFGISSRLLSRFMGHLMATIEFVHPNEKETQEIYGRIALLADGVVDGSLPDSE